MDQRRRKERGDGVAKNGRPRLQGQGGPCQGGAQVFQEGVEEGPGQEKRQKGMSRWSFDEGGYLAPDATPVHPGSLDGTSAATHIRVMETKVLERRLEGGRLLRQQESSE